MSSDLRNTEYNVRIDETELDEDLLDDSLDDEISEESVEGAFPKLDTEVYTFLNTAEDRWREIELLISKAEENEEGSEFYDVLCRATIILMAAQLEGYVKDLIKAIIADLNDNVEFEILPKAMKKTYAKYFLDTENDIKIKFLQEIFEEFRVKLKDYPFLLANKNTSPGIIEKYVINFGIEDFFSYLHNSYFDALFQNNVELSNSLIEDFKNYLFVNTRNFPFTTELDTFSLVKDPIKVTKRNRDQFLWVTFLDNLMQARHSVAHGSLFNNDLTVETLKDYKRKSKIVQYSIATILTNQVCSVNDKE